MSKQRQISKKQRVKILKFCSSNGAKVKVKPAKQPGAVILIKDAVRLPAIKLAMLSELVKEGLIAIAGVNLEITRAGKMHLRRMLSQVDEFQQQHRLPGTRKIETDGIYVTHISNEGESPLTRLRYRPAKNGKAYINDEEFRAGERLRQDFTRGLLTRQLTSNWNITQNEAGGSNGRNGIADLSDTALGARKRTEAAINAVGPEFTGVLVDICCFLKGLELVEKERRWPPRSAKLMLKTGLSILARHYGFSKSEAGAHSRPNLMRAWGSRDYKPRMFPD